MPRVNIHSSEDIKSLTTFYSDNVTYQRHHEEIRFKGSQLIVTLSAALIAVLKFTSGSRVNFGIAVMIILLGLLGVAQVKKHSERADRHARIARAYRKKIGEIAARHGATSVEEVHDAAAEAHKSRAGITCHLRARWFWLSVHIAIVAIGVAIGVLQIHDVFEIRRPAQN